MDPLFVRGRPDDAFDPASLPSDPELVERIRAEIEAGGPIPFARFMAIVLYDPERGYYRAADARPGRAGDFLTAPEAHPIFGRAIARQLDEVWRRLDRPAPFTVREPGAGGGALALGILDGLRRDASPLLDAIAYEPIEVDPRRLATFRERLAEAGHADRIGPSAAAIDAPGSGGPLSAGRPPTGPLGPISGAIVANEVVDALPVHRVRLVGGQLREVHVAWTGSGFADELGPPSTPALASRLAAEGVELAEGQQAEICLLLDDWLADLAAGLARGLFLVIDYGHPAAELYGPRRRDGTLRAYLRHRVHGDPYRHVGRQDLTAHVDLTAVQGAARAAGLDPLGTTTQAAFLIGCGLEALLEDVRSSPATTAAEWLELRSAVARMLDPAAMGRFAVLGFGRGLVDQPPLIGFRDPPATARPSRT